MPRKSCLSLLLGQFSLIAILGGFALFDRCADAQTIREDRTLGNESSRITRDAVIRGRRSDRIEGGARRGQNLFHSFEQFDIPENGGAYFSNPDGVQNIFSRVTGGDRSEINGRLGVIQAGSSDALGTANLFLINPNGILFGQHSSLDVGGSFAATTADAIQFGDQGIFSASVPEPASSLLTINPSAYLFNRANPGEIINLANSAAGSNALNRSAGLSVPAGQNLLFLGGNVRLEGGRLTAPGGRVEIGAIGGAGQVAIGSEGTLTFPAGLSLSDVLLTDNARIDVIGNGGGSIAVNARNVRIEGQSRLQAGIADEAIAPGNAAGDIEINATQAITLTGAVSSRERSGISNEFRSEAAGQGGNIRITTGTLTVENGAQLLTLTQGAGNAGDVVINAAGNVVVSGTSSSGNLSRLGSQTQDAGNAGDLTIRASNVAIRGGAQVFTNAGIGSEGAAGNLTITTLRRLYVGGASSIKIDPADGRTDLGEHMSRLTSRTAGTGDAGDMTLRARTVVIEGGAQVSASNSRTGATGNGGALLIQADRISVRGVSFNPEFASDSFSSRLTTRTRGRSDAGSLTLRARTIVVEGGAEISSGNISFDSTGNAGPLTIVASDRVRISGMSSIDPSVSSRVTAGSVGSGSPGDLRITAQRVTVEDGASISTERTINPNSDEVGTAISNEVGSVIVNANLLEAFNGGRIITAVADLGQAGNIIIRADEIILAGNNSGLQAITDPNSSGGGGTIDLRTNALQINDGASILTLSEGSGDAGNINVTVNGNIEMAGGRISTAAIEGSGGGITIEADEILLQRQSEIRSNVESVSEGGNIRITADAVLAFDDSDIVSSAAGGTGGNITLDTPAFFGENYQPDASGNNSDANDPDALGDNNRVDIDASGAVSGTITLPNVTFIQNSLTELPQTAIDTESLLASSCIVRNREQEGSFIITGTGSLPQRPGDALPPFATGTVRTIPDTAPINPSSGDRPWQLGDPITEPQDVYRLSDGRLVLSQECAH